MDKLLLFLISLTLLGSCVVQPNSSRTVGYQATDDSEETTTYAPNEVHWYTNQIINGTITLNESSQDILYLQGNSINQFLTDDDNFYNTDNSTKVYCLIINYNELATKKQLRFRAMPITLNTVSGTTKYFRIDIPETTINSLTCAGTVSRTLNVVGIPLVDTIDMSSEIGYSLDDLCPTCSSIYTSASLELYESTANSISDSTVVDTQKIDLSPLFFRVDTQSASSDPASTCTNTGCIAQGYDCCLDGQCVHDAETKPNASYEDDYLQALASVYQNPYNYILYPNIYFVCGNLPPAIPTPTPTPDAQASADSFLQENIADYNCLEGVKLDPVDYTSCSPANDYNSYITIRNDVWTRCGCGADPDDPAPFDPESACPDFGLKPIYDDDGSTILEIICDIPVPDVGPTPFQDTWVNVNPKNAAHRFFDDSGQSYDRMDTLIGTSTTQELDAFSYDDNLNKTEPNMETAGAPYNINAILGSMKIDLSSTLPAQVVDIDFESPYIITATTGSYLTLCSSCAPDQWNSILSPYPPAQNGLGVSPVGYTTSRILSGTNTSRGNYEDTLFGRACWVPPTMLPFSHNAYSTAVGQRQRRLETQAAMYVNGYQRDWYGFNKGAVIGSFDGVSWFAIGQGRRVVSTSTKLYLAINSPFNDLAEVASVKVTVINDQGYNGASNYDYDTGLEINDNNQNLGATCQKFHLCETDIDCVTQLGWEYQCADVSKYKSNWPRFDLDANELANDQHSGVKFTSSRTIIQNFSYSKGTNRCVYRGAGAPCAVDYSAITTTALQKLFTCAPNFYCAGVDTDVFNDELVRTPNQIESILYGQDADVLGRPRNYVGASDSLSSNIQSNIRANATTLGIASTNIGLCRPGPTLGSSTHLARHQNPDTQERTDYISQIASCDSTETSEDRIRSCPTFEMDPEEDEYGNYTFNTDDISQNSCGASSQSSGVSTFSDIEALRIPLTSEIEQPMLVKDGCLKKAGTPCHTNLDCGPNTLHSEQALFYDTSYFGKTLAEQDYWSQELICGQASQEPSIMSADYYEFDITKNRCCREIGKSFTMYTQDYGDVLLDPENVSENSDLDVDLFPSEGNMGTDGRYSRYESSAPLSTTGTIGTLTNTTPLVDSNAIPEPYQWRTISDTGRKTCCGGGWVRKFTDGGHDWNIRNRNQFIISSFKCLNYSTDLGYLDNPAGAGIDPDNYDKDLDRLCLSPVDEDQGDLYPEGGAYINNAGTRKGGGCIHAEMASVDKFEITIPTAYTPLNTSLDTFPYYDDESGLYLNHLSPTVPYMPLPYGGDYNYFKKNIGETVSFYLPIYIKASDVTQGSVFFTRWEDGGDGIMDGSDDTLQHTTATEVADCTVDLPALALNNTGNFCVDNSGVYTIFKGRYRYTGVQGGIKIQFTPYNNGNGTTPGNIMYYQTKLGRFELLGIPQIFYEPIYCNDDNENLVQDIFDPSITTEAQFIATGNSLEYDTSGGKRDELENIYDQETTFTAPPTTNSDRRVTTQKDVALAPVFMPNDFICCNELGDQVNSASQCCSNYATLVDGKLTCKLSRGTDLNVYFNRFVSGDGVGDHQPGGGFDDDDFIPETGEIKLTTEAYDKLVNLGGAYCASGKVRTGGAFGNFYPGTSFTHYLSNYQGDERLRKLSIIDSPSDGDDTGTSNRGTYDFQIGFRWNHHYYCE